jgi:hypothetical protein
MSVPIPLRLDFSATRLRELAKKAKDGLQARRFLTVAAIYDGATRSEAARSAASVYRSSGPGYCGSTRRALRVCWIESRQANPPSSMMVSARQLLG